MDVKSSFFTMKNKLFSENYLFFLLACYFLLLFLQMPSFSWSDQYFYSLFYEYIQNYSFLESFRAYPKIIGGGEPVYFLISYLSSTMISKMLFDVILNFAFVSSFLFLLKKNKIPKTVIIFLVTNIYFFVLFFITERLKVATIFLILFFIFEHNFYRIPLLLLSILSHSQSLILVPFLICFLDLSKLKSKKSFFFIFLAISFVLLLLGERILFKLREYMIHISLKNILKPMLFCFLGYFCIKDSKAKRVKFLSFYAPVLFAAVMIGEGRMTALAFIGCLYFWLTEKSNEKINFLVYSSLVYFSLRGLLFIQSGKLFGDGYILTFNNFYKIIN